MTRSDMKRSSDPEGKVVSTAKAYRFAPDESDDQWSIIQNLALFPGQQEYNSDYYTNKASTTYDWTAYGSFTTGQNQYRWRPDDDHTGSTDTTYNVGYGAAYISFNYDQPKIERTVSADSNSFDVNWNYNNGNANGGQSEDFTSGATVTSGEELNLYDGICELNVSSTFDNVYDLKDPYTMNFYQGLVYK